MGRGIYGNSGRKIKRTTRTTRITRITRITRTTRTSRSDSDINREISNDIRYILLTSILKKEKIKRRKNMLEKLQEIIAKGLGVEPAEVVESASFKDDLGADSLDLFEMVMSLEEEFGIEIPTDELEKINTVGDVMEYIKAHQ